MGKRDVSKIRHVVMTCNGSDCRKRGAKELGKCARKTASEMGAKKSTMFVQTQCTGLCKQAPVMVIQPANEFVLEASPKLVRRALLQHLGT